MPIRLGEGLFTPAPVSELREPTAEEVRLARIELILADLARVLGERNETPIHVDVAPADLTDIVNAVNGLRQGADADDIAEAVVRALHIPESAPGADLSVLGDLAKALETLDFRLQGVGSQAYGASGPSNISSDPDRRIGIVSGEGNMGALATNATLIEVRDRVATEVTLAALDRFLRPSEQISASGTGAAGAALTVTLPAVAGKTNYISAFTLTSGAAAVNLVSLDVTLTGVVGGTHTYRFVEPTTAGGKLEPVWVPALVASGPNQAISVVVPAMTGSAVTALNLTGFRL